MGVSSEVKVVQFVNSLEGLNFHDSSVVHTAGTQLEEFLLSVDADQSDLPPDLDSARIALAQKLYEQFETNLETSFADFFLRGDAQLKEYILYDRFKRLIEAEIKLANIKASDRVLFIGSGPLPISAILIEQKTGAYVDCFDHSMEACEISKEIISKLALSEKIRVIHQSAESVELPTDNTAGTHGHYDVIVVALLAQPKDQILHQLWRSVGPFPRIVLRYSEGNRKLIYKGMEFSKATWNNRYELGEHHSAEANDTISTLVAKTGAQPRIFKI